MKDYQAKARTIIDALGGKENLESIMACATRLRIDLKDLSLLDEKRIMNEGAHFILKLGGGAIQIIWGPTVNIMEEAIKKAIKASE